MRKWSIKIFLLDEHGDETAANVFSSAEYVLHESFGDRARQGTHSLSLYTSLILTNLSQKRSTIPHLRRRLGRIRNAHQPAHHGRRQGTLIRARSELCPATLRYQARCGLQEAYCRPDRSPTPQRSHPRRGSNQKENCRRGDTHWQWYRRSPSS